jgi:hypothetical protein
MRSLRSGGALADAQRLFSRRSRRSIARCLRPASLDDNASPCSSMAIRLSPPKKRRRIQDFALRIIAI